jgi:hypothetical protein
MARAVALLANDAAGAQAAGATALARRRACSVDRAVERPCVGVMQAAPAPASRITLMVVAIQPSGPLMRRLPRRRRSFVALTDEQLRALVQPILGEEAARADVEWPSQGVNNRTYIVRGPSGRAVVVKARPKSVKNVRNSPQWPRYTQDLFGATPDGALTTLPEIARLLRQHGAIRVPTIYVVDQSLEFAPCDYVIKEELRGQPFDWDSPRFSREAAAQLGDHLGRVHAATGGGAYGIFAGRELPIEDWWPRFQRSYRRLASDLCAVAPHLAGVAERLERALQSAGRSGRASTSALVCVDQSPSHYLADREGRIAAMVDLEAHLWAPRELELAVVELWVGHVDAFWKSYLEHASRPATMDDARPAYWLYTWMEWCYCMHTLLHDPVRALELERGLVELARRAA